MSRIIIVDDNENFRRGLKDVLNSMDHAEIIGEASNGRDFLELLSRVEADIVFMDVKMPFVDGISATKQAKKTNPEILIYAFSSYENEEYKNSMLNAGADGYLCKSHDNYEALNLIIRNSKTCNNAGLTNKNK